MILFVLSMLIGVALAVAGVVRANRGARRHDRDPQRALALLRGFRVTVLGLSLIGLSAGWWWEIRWLFLLSLCFLGEEMLEAAVVIGALRHDPGMQRTAHR